MVEGSTGLTDNKWLSANMKNIYDLFYILNKIDKFLERHKLLNITQEDTDNRNSPISIKKF